MCGIAGARTASADQVKAAIEAMCMEMVARGPDDFGSTFFQDGPGTIGLGSRRLSIIDPSTAGHQPMTDEQRNATIVFNGMIYNFTELRRELEAKGEEFRSHCDTEVILRAYCRWGSGCVARLRGMFAFAIWDEQRGELFLARDRLGIKPLYYWQSDRHFVFASQVKALLRTGLVPPKLSGEGIRTFLEFGAVSEPVTAIEGVYALPAAHFAVLRDGVLTINAYWGFAPQSDARLEEDVARSELRELLEDTTHRHLVSDAPLGVFLSGGVDSSILAALAAQQTPRVRTVSVVFDDPAFSEEPYIDAVTRQLETEHVRIDLGAADLLDWLDDACSAMDQPTFDGINTYVVSRAASATGLKVALSGLGGDELFNGYGYLGRVSLLERARRIPPPVMPIVGGTLRAALRGRQAEKAEAWFSDSFQRGSSYELLRRLFLPKEVARLWRSEQLPEASVSPARLSGDMDLANQIMMLELTNFTRNVLMRDTDFMSMANSLEARVPFLDHQLVEWALNLPAKLRARKGKQLLVDATRDLLPPALLNRPKQGFVLPIAPWMQNELRPDVEQTLRQPPQAIADLLDQSEIDRTWSAFLCDAARWLQPWSLYALCRWTHEVRAVA